MADRAVLFGIEELGNRCSSASRSSYCTCGEANFRRFHDREVDLGIVNDDDRIVTGEKMTPCGLQLDAYRLHKDDPRAQHLAEQQWNIGKKPE